MNKNKALSYGMVVSHNLHYPDAFTGYVDEDESLQPTSGSGTIDYNGVDVMFRCGPRSRFAAGDSVVFNLVKNKLKPEDPVVAVNVRKC